LCNTISSEMQNYTFFPNQPHKNPKAPRRPPQSSSLFCARAATRLPLLRGPGGLKTPAAPHSSFSWHPTPNGHNSHNKSARTKTPATRTVKTENSEKKKKLGKTCEIWKKLFIFAAQSVDGRNMVARLLVSRLRVRLPSPIQNGT